MMRIAKLSTILLTFFLLISLGLLGSVAMADKYVTVYEDGRYGHHPHHHGHGWGHRRHDCDEYVVVRQAPPRYYAVPAPYPAYYPPAYYAPAPSSGVHVSGGIFFNDVIR